MQQLRIGLLPLYIKLYDDALPQMRSTVEVFYGRISEELKDRGLEVVTAPVCRVKEEFARALKNFEKAQVDAIVTLHLAYSPSLESAELLAACRIPVIVLNTTPAFSFGPDQTPSEMLYNHGIHGVQDLCNVLARKGKIFAIEAGHWERSDVLARVVEAVRVARLTTRMLHSRVGQLGEPFAAMGDFAIEPRVLEEGLGVKTIACSPARLRELVSFLDPESVREEIASDRSMFVTNGIDETAHVNTTKACLALRRWLEEENLGAFTFNFLHITASLGLPTVPFLEASKAMARGVGYAGEGDVLTAAMVGALASVYPETTFSEMFCPDWENNTVYLSHMGEMNIRLAASAPRLVKCDYSFTDVCAPLAAVGCFRGGEAVLVDLAPQPEDKFRLILSPVKMMAVDGKDNFENSVHGWFRPPVNVADFLAEYSRQGGTHHFAIVYGDLLNPLSSWGQAMGWETTILQ